MTEEKAEEIRDTFDGILQKLRSDGVISSYIIIANGDDDERWNQELFLQCVDGYEDELMQDLARFLVNISDDLGISLEDIGQSLNEHVRRIKESEGHDGARLTPHHS